MGGRQRSLRARGRGGRHGGCMVFVRVVSCDLCFFGVQLLEKIDSP